MKTLHANMPKMHYAHIPSFKLGDGDKSGSSNGTLLDAYRQGSHAFAVWRWDRDLDANGKIFIINGVEMREWRLSNFEAHRDWYKEQRTADRNWNVMRGLYEVTDADRQIGEFIGFEEIDFSRTKMRMLPNEPHDCVPDSGNFCQTCGRDILL